jgi:hypothetical protein
MELARTRTPPICPLTAAGRARSPRAAIATLASSTSGFRRARILHADIRRRAKLGRVRRTQPMGAGLARALLCDAVEGSDDRRDRKLGR